jgi:hypothetical protein
MKCGSLRWHKGAAAGDALSLSNCTSTLFSRTAKKVEGRGLYKREGWTSLKAKPLKMKRFGHVERSGFL